MDFSLTITIKQRRRNCEFAKNNRNSFKQATFESKDSVRIIS